MVWLGPLVYQQLQSLILEVPKWVNAFMVFVQNVPEQYPDLVSLIKSPHFYRPSQVKSLQYLKIS
jgi:hypothetical protein